MLARFIFGASGKVHRPQKHVKEYGVSKTLSRLHPTEAPIRSARPSRRRSAEAPVEAARPPAALLGIGPDSTRPPIARPPK